LNRKVIKNNFYFDILFILGGNILVTLRINVIDVRNYMTKKIFNVILFF